MGQFLGKALFWIQTWTLLLHSKMLHLSPLLQLPRLPLKSNGPSKTPLEGFKLGSFRSVDWCCTTRSKSLLRKANNGQKIWTKVHFEVLLFFCKRFSFLIFVVLLSLCEKKGNFSQKFFFLSSSRKRKRPLSCFSNEKMFLFRFVFRSRSVFRETAAAAKRMFY